MNTLIGRWPWFFPFPLTLLCILATYCLAVPLNQWVPGSEPASAAILLLLFVFVYAMLYRFVVYVLTEPTTQKQKFFAWIDGFIALTHVLAGLFMTIVILSPTTDTHFSGIPLGTKGYDIFWTYGYVSVVLLFVTVGWGLVATTGLGAIVPIFSSVTGVSWIVMFWALVVRYVHIPPPIVKGGVAVAAPIGRPPPMRQVMGPRQGRGRPLEKNRKY